MKYCKTLVNIPDSEPIIEKGTELLILEKRPDGTVICEHGDNSQDNQVWLLKGEFELIRPHPTFTFINKGKSKKWFSVFAQFEYESEDKKDTERAKFRHPGDAYKYAERLVNDYESFAVRLLNVQCEC